MAETGTLHDAFIDELRDTYDAEKQLTKALPKLAKARRAPSCAHAFESHLEETRGQIERLEQVFEASTRRCAAKHCDGIAGIIEEGKSIMEEDFDETTMDACLIAAASAPSTTRWRPYGTLVAWAQAMGHSEAASLLQETLDEEKRRNEKLSSLAEGGINQGAADGAHPEEARGRARRRSAPAPVPASGANSGDEEQARVALAAALAQRPEGDRVSSARPPAGCDARTGFVSRR
jgi:ferritin-like metal-binding protein YciE